MQQVELIAGLLAILALVGAVAHRVKVALPVLLVIVGMAVSYFSPVRIRLEPDTVFFLFLPPLLYAAAFNTPWRELKDVLDWVSMQAIGLVLLTVLGVSAIIHAAVPGMPWSAAFVLGAIVSPTDAVAAAAISKEIPLPRRVMAIVNGESLLNDATGLVAYRFAVAAVVTGAFSWAEAGNTFLVVATGGIVVGIVLGWIISKIRTLLDHRPVEILSSLITPFLVYLTAEHLHVSGVLAVVTTGLMVGWYRPKMYSSLTRLQARSTWETVGYMLDGLSFLLMGLQVSHVVEKVKTYPQELLVVSTVAVAIAPTLIRLLWAFTTAPIYAGISRKPRPPWSDLLLFSWSGMRGVVSLAAAFALPLTCADGSPFPFRDLLIYLTIVVIGATLVFQGLTLPFLARRYSPLNEETRGEEELRARLRLSREAVRRIDEAARQFDVDLGDPDIEPILMRHLDKTVSIMHINDQEVEREAVKTKLEREAITAQRQLLIVMRNKDEICAPIFEKLQRELDIEEIRLDAGVDA